MTFPTSEIKAQIIEDVKRQVLIYRLASVNVIKAFIKLKTLLSYSEIRNKVRMEELLKSHGMSSTFILNVVG